MGTEAVDPGTLVVFILVVGSLIGAIVLAVVKYHYDKWKNQKNSLNISKRSQTDSAVNNGTEMTSVRRHDGESNPGCSKV